MKNTLLILLLLVTFGYAGACNLADATLISVTPGPGTDTTINVRVCFGGGVTGTVNGADGDTRTIAFGWFSQSPTFSMTSFSPDTITGPYTGCKMPGASIGPLGPPFNDQETVFYSDPGYYGYEPCASTPFTCVTSTGLCGQISRNCIIFSFVVSEMPDSMRVFGVEGGGNAIAGCYPDSDMLLDFRTLRLDQESDPFYDVPEKEELEPRVISVGNGQIRVYSPAVGRFPIELITIDGRTVTVKSELQIGENTIYVDNLPRGILFTKIGRTYQKHLVL